MVRMIILVARMTAPHGARGALRDPRGPQGAISGAQGASFFQKVKFSMGFSFFEPTHRNGLGAPGAKGPHGALWGPTGPRGPPGGPLGPLGPLGALGPLG